MKNYKISETITAFNLIVTPLIFFPNQEILDYYYYPKHIVLTLCSLLFLVQIWISRENLKDLFTLDKPTIYLLAFYGLMIVSTFFALDLELAINGNIIRRKGLATYLMYLLMFFAAKSSYKLNPKVFKYMLVTATIVSIYGIAQYFGYDIFRVETSRWRWTTYSTIGNPNFLGTYLVLMLPFAVHYWIQDFSKPSLVAYGIILYCLVSTLSRGPWIGALASLFVYFFFNSKNITQMRRKIIMLLGVTSAVFLIFFLVSNQSILNRFLSIFFDIGKLISNRPDSESAGSYRWFIWRRTFELLKARPFFGYGVSNLSVAFDAKYHLDVMKLFGPGYYIDEAHNEFLDIAVSTGIPSLIVYLLFIWNTFTSKIRKMFISDSNIIVLVSSISGYLVQSFFNISVVSVTFIFWILLGRLLMKRIEA